MNKSVSLTPYIACALLATLVFQQYRIIKILELKVEQVCFVYPPDERTGFKCK